MAREAQKSRDGLTIMHTAGADISAGQLVDLTECCGVAIEDIADTEEGPLAISGEFEVAQETGIADKVAGAECFYDFTQNRAEAAGAAAKCIGVYAQNADQDDALVKVLINFCPAGQYGATT